MNARTSTRYLSLICLLYVLQRVCTYVLRPLCIHSETFLKECMRDFWNVSERKEHDDEAAAKAKRREYNNYLLEICTAQRTAVMYIKEEPIRWSRSTATTRLTWLFDYFMMFPLEIESCYMFHWINLFAFRRHHHRMVSVASAVYGARNRRK